MRTSMFWLGLALGCTQDDDAGETIEIGAVLSASGDLAAMGTGSVQAVQLALDELNAAGGVLGKRLVLVNQDDATDPTVAPLAAERHVDAKRRVVIGANASSATMAAALVAVPASTVMISPSSTSPALSDLDDNGFVFRTCPSDALQGALLAQRARARGLGKAVVLFVPGAYGQGMADTFASVFEGDGGLVMMKEPYTEGEPSYVALLTSVFTDPPDVIALPGYPADSAQIVTDYLDSFAGYPVTFLFGDSLATDDFVAAVGAERFVFPHEGTAPSFTGPGSAHFTAAYVDTYGAPPTPFASNAYDGAMLAALAIQAAGKAQGAAIRDHLKRVSSDGDRYGPDELVDLLQAIKRGDDVDYVGASGEVDFDDHGDVVAPYDIWEVAGEVTITEQAVLPAL